MHAHVINNDRWVNSIKVTQCILHIYMHIMQNLCREGCTAIAIHQKVLGEDDSASHKFVSIITRDRVCVYPQLYVAFCSDLTMRVFSEHFQHIQTIHVTSTILR